MEVTSSYISDRKLFLASITGIMGTRFEILMADEADRNTCTEIFETIEATLVRIDAVANRFDAASEVSKINSSEPMSMVYPGPELAAILAQCRDYALRTDGLFDVTLEGKSDFVFSDDGALVIPNDGLRIDLGGFAKGYAMKHIRQILKDYGMERAFVNFGNSSICAVGTHPYGDSWKVSLPDPFTGKILKVFDLKDMSMSTSGNTPEYRGHIINPRTGERSMSDRTAVIIAPDALDAEILSTVWIIAEEDEKKKISSRFDIVEACLF